MQKTSFVHMALDWDAASLEAVTEAQGKRGIDNLCGFSDWLRHKGVPTFWVSLNDNTAQEYILLGDAQEWSLQTSQNCKKGELVAIGYGNLPVKTDEAVFVIHPASLDIVGCHVEEKFGEVRGFIVSGWLGDAHLQPALVATAEAGFNVYAVTDHMANKGIGSTAVCKVSSIEEWCAKKQIELAGAAGGAKNGPKRVLESHSTKQIVSFMKQFMP